MFQWVEVTNTANGKTAYGLVRDKCPGCGQYGLGGPTLHVVAGCLLIRVQDMSIGLFEKLGDLNTGVLPITWHFMPKEWSP